MLQGAGGGGRARGRRVGATPLAGGGGRGSAGGDGGARSPGSRPLRAAVGLPALKRDFKSIRVSQLVSYFSVPPRAQSAELREILTLGEGFNTQVVTQWCFNIVSRLEHT